ncbi:hypothetical protein ACF061_21605 [Streptomyces sp. NPDC015220]|uniref:hypothetical protein n=1 Tax=Streptomyces sp. NPDC015220 TaxID=3364947 RepID=UPI0036FAE763
MIHPRRTSKALAAIALAWVTALAAAPAAPAADRPAATVGQAAAEPSAPAPVRYLWAGASVFDFSLDDGATTRTGYYQSMSPPPVIVRPRDLDSGTDVQNTVTSDGSVTTVAQTHRASGEAARFTLPKGQVYRASTGWSVVVGGAENNGPLRVWRPSALLPVANAIEGNQVTGIPSGAYVYRVQPGGSVHYMAVAYSYQGVRTVGLIDLATYAFKAYGTDVDPSTQIRFDDQWFATDEGPNHTLHAVRVGSASGTAPTGLGDGGAHRLLAVVGDRLLLGDPEPDSGEPPSVVAVSAVDHTRRSVLTSAQNSVAVAQDGTALAAAEDDAGVWWVYHLVPGGDQGLTASSSWILTPQESP